MIVDVNFIGMVFTLQNVEQILRNVGVDTTCGACMCLAITGSADRCEHTCKRSTVGEPAADRDPVCPGCGQPIDTDVCWCGALMADACHEGHTPICLGCDCGCCLPSQTEIPEVAATWSPTFAFGHIPSAHKCERCRDFDLDGCPSCPGFRSYD